MTERDLLQIYHLNEVFDIAIFCTLIYITSQSFLNTNDQVGAAPVAISQFFMHPFASYVLRSYYKATGWNEDNLYANLTRSSSGQFHFQGFHSYTYSPS